MGQQVFDNIILDRLPMSLSGITHVDDRFTGEVCPKLHIQKRMLAIPS
ncbi:hypothetical protein [Vallitalea okinawensis]|nr:hypothetical protein [Vallitalea okinawensis]